MKEHMNKYYNDIRNLKTEYNKLTTNIQLKVGRIFSKIIIKSLEKFLHEQIIESFTKKNKKIYNLLKSNKHATTNYTVPIINLFSYILSDAEYNQLKFGINHSFVNKDKRMKKHRVANMECLAYSTSKYVDQSRLGDLHEFLCAYTDRFTYNVLKVKDETFKNLKKFTNS